MELDVYQRSVYTRDMSNRHEHSSLIDQIGAGVVSAHFRLSPQRLHMWRVRGIPHLRRLAFKNLADGFNVSLPGDFLDELLGAA